MAHVPFSILNLLRYYGPLLLFMVLIFWTSSRSQPPLPIEAPDYVLHAGTFFILALLASRAFAFGLAKPAATWKLWAALAVSILFGLSDEWHQSYVPGRHVSLRDVAADSIGALLAVSGVALLWKTRGASKSSAAATMEANAGGRRDVD
ncbi:MAG TPA: VanZ family protein [Vicinamibacteria bacterium]|nr:VanZ family protein [Vicinamibacteria bacterium]